MEVSGSVTEEWYVIFTNPKYKNVLAPFLQEGFHHVFAMKKTEGGLMWQIINPMRSHIHVDIEAVDTYPHPRLYAGGDAIILPVKAKIDTLRFRGTLGVFNCVEVVKGLLGIKEFWIWTPYQLYKHLRGYYE
jgi:hypothetical protein